MAVQDRPIQEAAIKINREELAGSIRITLDIPIGAALDQPAVALPSTTLLDAAIKQYGFTMSRQQTAKMLDITVDTLDKLCRAGDIPHYRNGHVIKFRTDLVLDVLAQRTSARRA